MIAMSGEKPEDIPPAPPIKKLVEARRRRAKKQLQNKPQTFKKSFSDQVFLIAISRRSLALILANIVY